MKMWERLLRVEIKGSLFTFANFYDCYNIQKDEGFTITLMEEYSFMEMKEGLSKSASTGDDQRVINRDYDLKTGGDRTGDLETWGTIEEGKKIPLVFPTRWSLLTTTR